MTIRALTSPATGLAVAAVLLALLSTGGAAPLSSRTSASVATAREPGAVTASERVGKVPSSAKKRRDLGILSNGCRYNPRGIPRCGVLLGAAYGANSDPILWEREMGHRLGVHRTYYAGYEVDEAVETARIDLMHQRVPWVSFKLPYTWGEMAAGQGDDWARELADAFSKLDGPVWVAFHHEPEGDGDIREWTAMQERLAPIVRAAAPNVAYSVILTGWNQLYGAEHFSLESAWPDTRIDLVGFDVYNKYGVVENGLVVDERTQFKRDYFTKIERFAEQHDVAWGLAETGHTDLSAQVEPKFVQHIYRGVRNHGGVAVAYFNTDLNSIADWRLNGPKGTEFAATLRTTPTL
jgi:hypothetical protein